MGHKPKRAVCGRDCFNCMEPDCICDDGPNLEEYRLSAELDRFAWLQAQGLENEHRKWREWYRSNRDYQRQDRAAKQAAYRESNREACNARRRAHRAANRDAFIAYQRAYRARKKAEKAEKERG